MLHITNHFPEGKKAPADITLQGKAVYEILRAALNDEKANEAAPPAQESVK